MSEEVLPASAPTKGIVMLSSELQPENAPIPILVTESGIVTEVTPVQLRKAFATIPVTAEPLYVDGTVML